ncbi:MAG: helix-turn-helix domain-containing protein [Flavobacteriaceae bacterium]
MKQPELGIKISELRKQKGLTQEELVHRCNINVRTLQRIESGEVTPRSYTIKTILSALDHDYESLYENNPSKIKPISASEAKSSFSLLTITWVAGILFLVAAVFEGIVDWYRFYDGELIFGRSWYMAIKIMVLVFNCVLLFGFLITGKLLNNYLMKIAAVLMAFALFCFCTYDIISLFRGGITFEVIILAEAITFGALGILFGISIIKSSAQLGRIAYVSGGMELLTAFCLLTVFLAPLALFLFFPTIILEVLVLVKMATMVKEQLRQ